ncbi:MAG: hypothetical protein AAGF12_38770, partial [Myxococcota bacterium]
RGRLLARLHQDVAPFAAEALAPLAPGLVSPEGSPSSVRRVPRDAVLRQASAERNLRIRVVAPTSEEDARRFIEGRLPSTPASEDAAPPALGTAPPGEIVAETLPRDDAPIAVIAWLAEASDAPPETGREAARALAGALDAVPELQVTGWTGGAFPGAAYAAVGIRAPEDRFDALPQLVETALAQIPDDPRGAPSLRLPPEEALFRSADRALDPAVYQRLIHSPARFVIARPR